MRHAIWAAALLVLLLMPVVAPGLPGFRVEGLYVSVEAPELVDGTFATPAVDRGLGYPTARTEVAQPGKSASETGAPLNTRTKTEDPVASTDRKRVAQVAVLIWALGAALLLARLGLHVLRAWVVTRRAVSDGDANPLEGLVAADVGLHRPARVLLSADVFVPSFWGLFRPTILLPTTAAEWSEERKRAVLLHEFAHIRRHDYLVHLVAELATALYWPNPLVWLAARRCAMERERACDDLALVAGTRSDLYAGHLLEIARGAARPVVPQGTIELARRSSLRERIASILRKGTDRRSLSRRALLLTGLFAASISILLAALEVWGVSQRAALVRARLDALESSQAETRSMAAWSLGELESHDAVLALVQRLKDDEPPVRLISAWALGEIKDHAAIEPLTRSLADPDRFVREMAVLALGEIENPAAVDELDRVRRQDPDLLDPVIWALSQIENRRGIESRALMETGWGNRSTGEVWAGRLGAAASTLLTPSEDLVSALESTDPERRRSAAYVLGLRGEVEAVAPLLRTLRDEEPAVRAMAVWALDEINPSRSDEG